MNRLLGKPLTLGFGIALAVLLVNAVASAFNIRALVRGGRSVIHSREVIDGLDAALSACRDAEAGQRGYLLTGHAEQLGSFQNNVRSINQRLDALKQLTPADGRVLELRRLMTERLALLRQAAEVRKQRGLEAALTAVAEGPDRRASEAVRTLVEEMKNEEEARLRQRTSDADALVWRTFGTVAVATLLGLGMLGTAHYLVRRSQRWVRETEERSRLLLESTGEGVYGIDNHGRCTFANPACARLLGCKSPAELIGQPMHRLIHHTRADGTPYPEEECPIYRAVQHNKGTHAEEVFWRRDGTSFPVEYHSYPIQRGRRKIGAVVSFLDVSERRRAEETMRLRDRALRAIAQGIFITDPTQSDEPISYVNEAFERLTGYTLAEVKGRDVDFLYGPGTNSLSVAELRAAFREGHEADAELLCYRKDGSQFWGRVALSPVQNAGGLTTHFVGVVTDVSERKRSEELLRGSEERLRLMVESVRDYAIFSLDVEGQVSSWNSGAERLFGFSESEVLGQPWALLFVEEDSDAGVPDTELASAALIGRVDDERWHVRKDGSRFFVSGILTSIRDEAGRLLGFTQVARDVTERRRFEEELRTAKEAAEVASKAKSQFLANMSHELRTPLNAVILYSELLQEEATDLEVEEFIPDLEKIRAAGKHLLALVNGVLDLSKIEAGKMELYLETFDVAEIIRDVSATVQPLVQTKNNTLEVHCAADIGPMYADLTKVRQILFNLLSNASKFTERGLIALDVSREKSATGEQITFRVFDTGIGMTAEQMERLFQPFNQADASTTRKYGGTGLGLAIARRFCEMMGGEITVTSEPGQGTTFRVRLPARMAAQSETAAAVVPAAGAAAGTVLVVDDDAGVRGFLSRFLAAEGFRALLAADGKEGLRLAQAERPDLILLDVIMPRMDGWAVLTALKADPALADIPVILLTIADDSNMGYLLGASEYLTKPVDTGRLTSLLERYRGEQAPRPVLVVEDDPATRQVLGRALAKDGWPVIEAENGRAGLERLTEVEPAAILLDLMMPEMDGFEFLAELRQQEKWRAIPVVVLTARDLSAQERLRLRGQVERILQKGASSREELLREVRAVLDGRLATAGPERQPVLSAP